MSVPSRLLRASFLPALVVALAQAGRFTPAHAQPVVGFVEEFAGTSTSTWMGGAIFSNPGGGGIGGGADGYLDVLTVSPANLGTVSFGTEYAGDWTAAGVTQVRAWLNNLGDSFLEVHLSISAVIVNDLTTWQQDAGLIPPFGGWSEYVVDLQSPDFTPIRGSASFTDVLQNVDRLHYRHDVAPFEAAPDPVAGHFGLDHIQLTDGSVTSVPPGARVARPMLLDPLFPNPSRGRVMLSLRRPSPLPVRLTIVDAAGRQVRHAELPGSALATRLWLWDGTNDAGQAAPAGVYRVIARGENGGMSRSVTLLR